VRRAIPFGFVIALLLAPTPLLAQTGETKPAEDPALIAARDQFIEGVSLMAAEDWANALTRFKAAGRFKMSAQVAFNIAECESKLGRLVAALGNYRLALSKADTAGAETVKDLAPKRINELTAQIPKLTVKKAGEGSATARALLDGQELATTSQAVPVDPGEHVVTLVVNDKTVATERVTLKQGETRELTIAVPENVESDGTPQTPTSSGVSVPGIVLISFGAASMIGGGVSIGVRQAAISELDDLCGPDNACPADAEATYDRGRLATGFAEVLIPLGAVSVVVGSILVATSGPSAPEEAPSSARLEGVSLVSADGTGPGLSLWGAF
jgi:hypothetical protein